METEALSLKTYEPTDYLEVDYKEKFFGKQRHRLIHNSTRNVLLRFRTDLLFSKRGFFLYFQTVPKLEQIDMEEELTTEAIQITITTTTTKTTTSRSSVTSTQIAAANSSMLLLEQSNSAMRRALDGLIGSDKQTNRFDSNSRAALLALALLVVALSLAVVLLILTNRKRIFNGRSRSSAYKTDSFISRPIHPRMNDTSVFSAHLENSRMSGINFIHHQFNPLLVPTIDNLKLANNNASSCCRVSSQRISDDSMTHLLLLNASSASYIEPTVYEGKRPPQSVKQQQQQQANSAGEVYDDISLKEMDNEVKLLRKKETGQGNSSAVKLNEYCYIHANGLVIGNIENGRRATAAGAAYPIEISTQNLAPSLIDGGQRGTCSTLASGDLQHSPAVSSVSSASPGSTSRNVTSTPSLPKTLPPSFTKFECIEMDLGRAEEEQENTVMPSVSNNLTVSRYQTCPEMAASNEATGSEYGSALRTVYNNNFNSKHEHDDEINSECTTLMPVGEAQCTLTVARNELETEEDDEYQVPTNIPKA